MLGQHLSEDDVQNLFAEFSFSHGLVTLGWPPDEKRSGLGEDGAPEAQFSARNASVWNRI
jgi:hypothetical protein